jgi:hypothetical protein
MIDKYKDAVILSEAFFSGVEGPAFAFKAGCPRCLAFGHLGSYETIRARLSASLIVSALTIFSFRVESAVHGNSTKEIPTRSPRPRQPREERGILMYMKTNGTLSTLLLSAALLFIPSLALSQDTGAKQDLKTAGHETKDAAKNTGHAVKKGTVKTYDATKNGTEKAVDTTKTDTKKAYHATAKGTKKVVTKTKDTTKGAVEGAKEGAKKPD